MITKDETRRPTLISSTDCRSFTKLNMLRFCLKYVGMKTFLWREILAFEDSKNTWYSSPIIFMAHLPQNLRSLSIPAYRPVSISSLWLQHLNFTIFLKTFRGSLSKYASSSNLFLRFLYKMHLVLASIILDHSCLNWSWSLVFKSSLVASMLQLIPCWIQIYPKPLRSNIVRTQVRHSDWKLPSMCILTVHSTQFWELCSKRIKTAKRIKRVQVDCFLVGACITLLLWSHWKSPQSEVHVDKVTAGHFC